MPSSLRPPSFSLQSCRKRSFSSSSSLRFFPTASQHEQIPRRVPVARRIMFNWLEGSGAAFKDPSPYGTNYLSAYNKQGQLHRARNAPVTKHQARASENGDDQSEGGVEGEKEGDKEAGKEGRGGVPPEKTSDLIPFPLNKEFVSQPVLSEELREEIWSRVMRQGKTVRTVSTELGVEMQRVGAVVRLMEIEKNWIRLKKPLALPYARAVMSMLPKTPYDRKQDYLRPHESINDLSVHPYTRQQIFHPTSESRHFTRADAAKVFHENLLPADKRVPHPQLIEEHKDFLQDMPERERKARVKAREKAELSKMMHHEAIAARREAAILKIDRGRVEFRITKVNVDDIGPTGRGPKGVGWRYGVPHMDRKRGAHKIPTTVG